MEKQADITLTDGEYYLVTFNQGQDCVEAQYIAEYALFNFFAGSIAVIDAERIEPIHG